MKSSSDSPSNQEEINKAYTNEQFDLDFPDKMRKCRYCKKHFITRFDAKDCSDKCAIKFLFYHNKSDRNLVGKDARRLKGTGRRKKW